MATPIALGRKIAWTELSAPGLSDEAQYEIDKNEEVECYKLTAQDETDLIHEVGEILFVEGPKKAAIYLGADIAWISAVSAPDAVNCYNDKETRA